MKIWPFLLLTPVASAQLLEVELKSDKVRLQWQRTFPQYTGVPSFREYLLRSSTNLKDWSDHSLIRIDESEGDGISTLDLPLNEESQFFRLDDKLFYAHRSSDAAPPALYEQQYDNAFNSELTLEQFREDANDPTCLDGIDWDPTTAAYFTEFNTTPADHNANLSPQNPERRITDFTLNDDELEKFSRNGFMVRERAITHQINPEFDDFRSPVTNPVDMYYAVWTDDLPVFITADSVLDAWHQTFASILEELDEIAIYPSVKQLLIDWDLAFTDTKNSWDWPNATTEENEHMQDAIDLVTFYMDVAQSFSNTTPPTSSPEALDWYNDLADPDPTQVQKWGMFGDRARFNRPNLYKPRGRYTNSSVLSAHFRTMIWLSRAQFHIAHSDELTLIQRNRELRAAVLLALTIRDGGLMEDWKKIEAMLQGVAGQPDAMSLSEMVALLEANSLDSLSTIASESALANLRSLLLSSTYGLQEVNGGYYEFGEEENICEPDEIEQPRAFSLFGQRWTPDS